MRKAASRFGLTLSLLLIVGLLFSTTVLAATPITKSGCGTNCLTNCGTNCKTSETNCLVNCGTTGCKSSQTPQLQTLLSGNSCKTNLNDALKPYLGKVQLPKSQPVPAPAPKPAPAPTPDSKQPTTPVSGLTSDEQKMIDLVNAERTSRGLKPLTVDMRLVKTARMKSQDMIDKGYFDHNSPTYGSPFDLMKSQGITYRYAGENLAGMSTVDGAHNGLMNSPGHRANILNANYTHIGIGIIAGGRYGKMFTQHFIGVN